MELPIFNNVPCQFPYSVENPKYKVLGGDRYLPVPCGRCPSCCERRANSWIFRLLQHEKITENAAFVTLTYSTDHVPLSPRGFMTLDKRDYQLFMKRLRKLHGKNSQIRYYAVGEYGSTYERPHFHAILFDFNPEHIETAWGLGDVYIGTVSGASIAYTAKYISKGKTVPKHANDDRIPEFSLMSKKLGSNYLTPQMIAYHKADLSRNYLVTEGGVKIALPRYYREKIYSEEERTQQGYLIKQQSELHQAKTEKEYIERTGTPDSFIKHQFEAKKQAIKNYREKHKSNRKSF